jgi:hypothetical protein
MAQKVFIAYDFEIKGNLIVNLEAVKKRAPTGFEVEWPGYPGDNRQGAIWKDIVHPSIGWCDRLLAFVDLPNANVGFELGYAFGLEKQTALARVRGDLPAWLNKPPLNGFFCEKADTPEEIRNLISSERWVNPSKPPVPGDRVLLLCPHHSGSAYLEEIDADWGWRQPEKHGWDLHNVPNLFSGIGRVVWIIVSHNEGPEGRDGEENTALAVLAGYAHARQLPNDIFQHTEARPIADVVSQRQLFSALVQVVPLLKAISDEQQRIVADKATAVSTGPINHSLTTVAQLMDIADIQRTATRFRVDFERAKQEIEPLRAYKDLHDGLHKLQIDCYDLIVIEINSFPYSKDGIGNLRRYLQRLEELLYDLRQVVVRRCIREEETSWVEELLMPARNYMELALGNRNREAFGAGDKETLQGAADLLSLVLGSRLSMINTSLYRTADSLKLPKLVAALNVVSDCMTRLPPESVDIARFQKGIDCLFALSTRLDVLIKLHNTLQGIDNELRHIAISMAARTPLEGAGYLKTCWPILKSQVQSLRGDQNDPYTVGFQAYATDLESALDEGVGIEIQREFLNLLSQSKPKEDTESMLL